MKYFRYLFLKFEYFFFSVTIHSNDFFRLRFHVFLLNLTFIFYWATIYIEPKFELSFLFLFLLFLFVLFFSTSPAFSSFHSFSPVMVGLRLFSQWKEVFESFRYFWFFFLRFISNSKNCWRVKLPKKLNALNSNVKQQKKNCWTASKFWSQ